MLLHGDGTNGGQNNTFLDSSTNNFTITRNGNTTQGSFSPYGPNWSNYFDGSGDYLTTATSASAFSFGTGDFTIEFWINSTQTTRCDPVGQDTNFSASGWWGLIGNLSSSGQLQWFENANSRISATATNWNNGSWNHIAVTRSGNSVRMFVNGTQVGSTYTTSFTYGDASVGVIAGVLSGDKISGPLTGYLSNLRIVKGTALYTGTFTPSTTPLTAVSGTSLLTCADNRFIDDSTNNLTITRTGDVSVQRFSPFAPTAAYSTATIGGSGYFDGAGDWLDTADAAALEPGSSSFTAEAWVYATVEAGGAIFGKWNSAEATERTFLVVREADATITAYWNISNSLTSITTTNTIPLNTWGHVALVRNGSTFTVYVNGVASGTSTTSSALDNRAITYAIGATSNGGFRLTGYISGHRYVVGTAVYTANFTPPTAPPSAVTNTQLLLNFTNGAIFDNAMMNDLETVGNAQISTSVVKYGTGSMAFDGAGDWLQAPASPVNGLGSGDFTVEMWVYMNNTTGTQVFYDNTVSGNGPALYSEAGSLRWYDGTVRNSGGTISAGVWTHIAVARASTNLRFFINGVQTPTGFSIGTNYGNNVAVRIGSSFYSEHLNGYIDDLRITKGVARYTANFTPPTAAFPDI